FCYTGGFSIAALEGGASLVHSVDSSARAMEGTRKNVELTEHAAQHEGFTKEVMPFLKSCNTPYDVVVLDPPAYAKHLSQVSQAMIGYRNLNTEGLKSVSPGGLLFTFSCSQAVDRELFRKLIFQAGLQAGRNLRILHQLTQPADHPVSIYHPEAEYLKGLVLHVT
ncbi:MAG: class I SAM-dependent rRNA methyltransferase, partial [Bacteroidota bacterium]